MNDTIIKISSSSFFKVFFLYISHKAALNTLGVNLSEIDLIKE